MVENTKRVVSIYLEDWQMRLIKDVRGETCHILDVPVEEPIVYMYGVHEKADPKETRMYFTSWQKTQLFDEAEMTCNFIEISKVPFPPFNMRYAVPPK